MIEIIETKTTRIIHDEGEISVKLQAYLCQLPNMEQFKDDPTCDDDEGHGLFPMGCIEGYTLIHTTILIWDKKTLE